MHYIKKLAKKIHHFFSGYYTVLLLSLALLFIFRPYDRNPVYLGIWKFFLTAVFLSAIFNCNHLAWVKKLAFVLAVPAIFLSWLNLFRPSEPLFVLNASVTILFMILCTSSILYDVVIRARVTLETLRGVVCAYFMVAFAFAYMYYLIEYTYPGSFHISSREVAVTSYIHYISEMLYFSFVTLLTIGYGDITALDDVGQTVCVIEGIIGQFYIAILVSRLVSVYSFYSDKRLLNAFKHELTDHPPKN